MPHKCIDISKHNGELDFMNIKNQGVDAVIVRAGYGMTTDPLFVKNINEAKKAGLAVGVYWFAYPLKESDAIKEADYMYNLLKAYRIELGVWYDFEYDTERYARVNGVTFSNSDRTKIIKAFCDKMKSYGYDVGIYINPDYLNNKVIWNELKTYKLWLAAWVSNDKTSFDKVSETGVNTTYGSPTVWQFGIGNLSGLKSDFDLNYYYGELDTKELTIDDYINTLSAVGIITNIPLWRQKASKDNSTYWLIRKTAEHISNPSQNAK